MPDTDLKPRLSAAIEANWPAQQAWLQELVRFRSLRGEEGPCQDWIAREMAGRGWSVDRYRLSDVPMDHLPAVSPMIDTDYDRAIQVVGTLRAPDPSGRSLILQGHVDIVPEGPARMWTDPPYAAVIREGWMYGRGAGDMKGGISCMMFALDALKSAGLAPAADVFVQTVTEEESTGNGALSTLARGYRADACLIPEPSGMTLTRAHTGTIWFRLSVSGYPVHVAYSERGSNAILSTYGLIGALQKLTAEMNEEAESHPVYRDKPSPVKFNPGIIRGGDWASSTPAWCELDCRIGLLPGTPPSVVQERVRKAVEAAARADPFLANSPPVLTWTGFLADGFVLEPGSDAETVLGQTHQAVTGHAIEERIATGVNDTRFYTLNYGIPALCYGPRGEGSHAYDERVELASLKETTLVIASFVASWCGVSEIASAG